jgi:hypothetical protein
MNWTVIDGEELDRLEMSIRKKTDWKPERLVARRMKLPFYENGSLLRLEDETGRTHAVEVGNSALIPLDGSASQIGLANEMAGLRLNIDNVLAYAMFFCGFLEIQEGEVCSFVTSCGNWYLDTGFVPQDLTPKVEESDDGSKAYTIHAYLAHTGGLFLALLKVEPNGIVMMLDDEPLGQIVCLQ